MSGPFDRVLRSHDDGVLVDVWAVPGAKREMIAGLHDGALKVRISQPPEGGKANRRLAALLGPFFGVRPPQLVSGATGRRKTFLLVGIELSDAIDVLNRDACPGAADPEE